MKIKTLLNPLNINRSGSERYKYALFGILWALVIHVLLVVGWLIFDSIKSDYWYEYWKDATLIEYLKLIKAPLEIFVSLWLSIIIIPLILPTWLGLSMIISTLILIIRRKKQGWRSQMRLVMSNIVFSIPLLLATAVTMTIVCFSIAMLANLLLSYI